MKIILTFLLALMTNLTMAANYYFSNLGDDSYTSIQAQNPATPWRTLSRLNSIMSTFQSGDSILFRRGDTFIGNISLTRSGLIFSSYGIGAKPIISNFVDLNFTNIGGNLYESQLVNKPEVVIQSNQLRLPGRFPNTGYLFYESSLGNNSITDNQLTGNWTGGEVVVRKNNTIIDKGIISQIGQTIIFPNISPDGFLNGYGYFIQNHPNALDINGEWCYTGGRVRIFSTSIPSGWKSSNGNDLFLNNGFTATIENIKFSGTNNFGVNIINNTVVIRNCDFEFIGSFGVRINDANNSSVVSCIFNNVGNTSIFANNSSNLLISQNTINNSGIEGMGQSLNITNLAYDGIHLMRCPNSIVSLNKIDQIGYNGITFYFSSNLLIDRNEVSGWNKFKEDGGGIYTWNDVPEVFTNIIISNNIVRNGIGAMDAVAPTDRWKVLSQGIYIDNNCRNISIINNSIFDNPSSGIYIHNSRDLIITGNKVYNNGLHPLLDPGFAGQIRFHNDNSQLIRNVTMNNNDFVSRTGTQWVVKWDSNNNDISLAGSFNNNVYARPIDDNIVFRIFVNGWPTTQEYNLTGWKNYSGLDINSLRSPKPISTLSELRFEYNNTILSSTRNLGNGYIGFRNNIFLGTVTLSQFSSQIMLLHPQVLSLSDPLIQPNRTDNIYIKLFPNPVTNHTKLIFNGSIRGLVYYIFNYDGKLVKTGNIISTTTDIDMSMFSRGVYYILVDNIKIKIIKI